VLALYNHLLKEHGPLGQVTIFGELFGGTMSIAMSFVILSLDFVFKGTYPNKSVPKDPHFPMHVQKGVYYCPSVG